MTDSNTKLTGITFQAGFQSDSIVSLPSTLTTIGDGTTKLIINGLDTKTFRIQANSSLIISQNAFKDIAITEFDFNGKIVNQLNESAFENSQLRSITLQDFNYTAANVFKNCQQLRDVTFPTNATSLKKITSHMFESCNKLYKINIPAYIKEIETFAFYNSSIEELTFQTGLTTIGISAFQGCQTPSINLPISLTTVGKSAFAGCNTISQITLPIFTTKCDFGVGLFESCVSLSNIIINGQFKDDTIPESLCKSCTSLKQVIFTKDNNALIVGKSAFESCAQLKEITFESNTITELKDRSFYGTAIDYLYLPSGIKTFNQDCFSNCPNLVQLIIENSAPIFTNEIMTASSLVMKHIIFSKLFTQLSITQTFTLPTNCNFYVFSNASRLQIEGLNEAYKQRVIVKPYMDKKYVDHKLSYESENDPSYVMYTLLSSGNTFTNCMFFFKNASKTSSAINIITNTPPFIGCVKMYSASADIEGKTVQKIFKSGDVWKFQANNGLIYNAEQITSTYVLQDNFICDQQYDGRTLTLDASSLAQCDAQALSNLTSQKKTILAGLNRVKLTSLQDDTSIVNIQILTGSPIFEVNDMDTALFNIEGQNCTLILENLTKSRSKWQITAPNIVIHEMWIDYMIFRGQKTGTNQATITKIECTDVPNQLIKFTANQAINFQLIQNKNEQLIDPTSTQINALYYVAGWSQ